MAETASRWTHPLQIEAPDPGPDPGPDPAHASAAQALSDWLTQADTAQTALLADQRLADDYDWIWPSHARLVAALATPIVATPHTTYDPHPQGPFKAALLHSRTGDHLRYCEGYRVPLNTTSPLTASPRHAWVRDVFSGELHDQHSPPSGPTLYLGLEFTPGLLRWFLHQQQPHPLLDRAQHLATLDPTRGTAGDPDTNQPPSHHDNQPDPEQPLDAHDAVQTAREALARLRTPSPQRSRRDAVFMGVLDHVGPGVLALRDGLVFPSSPPPRPKKKPKVTPAPDPAFDVISGFGDPPPF